MNKQTTSTGSRRFHVAALYLLIFLSGFAGLGYEMVWTQMLSLSLGHEISAVLAVIAAFFTGLALGAFSLDRHIRRSHVPGRWYAALELITALWALLLIGLLPNFNQMMAVLMGAEPSVSRHWLVAFAGTFLLLLPATAAMGGTLPAMERLFSGLRQDGWAIGGLYASNTLGAMAGTMVATFVIAPAYGFARTLTLLAAINAVCAVTVLVGAARGEKQRRAVTIAVPDAPSRRRLVIALLVTGLLGIGYEVLVVRVLSQVLENTIYTFASILSVYLFGTALGAALYQRVALRAGFDSLLTGLLQLASLACLVGIGTLWVAGPINNYLSAKLGAGVGNAIASEIGVAAMVFLAPTLVMGAIFSHLAQAARDQHGFGWALGLNMIGAAFAPLLFGVVALPALGAKLALVVVAAGYLLLIPPRPARAWVTALAPASMAALILFAAPPLRFVTVPPGGEMVAYAEGIMASVAVVRDRDSALQLKVDDRYTMGGTATSFSDRRQAHIPLLLHGAPRDALFLGLGPGMTFAAAVEYPELEATGVELVPEILPMLHYFGTSPVQLSGDARLRIVAADARRYVHATQQQYDVIVADLFHPARDGAGALYTVEHFEAIRAHLSEGGLFCQWLPLYQLDLPTLRTIIRTFVEVFPEAQAYLGHYSLRMPILGLVGGRSMEQAPAPMGARIRSHRLAAELKSVRLDSDFELLGGFLGAGRALRRFAGEGPLNTDDHPVVIFEAPEFVYAAPQPSWGRLLALIDGLNAEPGQLLDQPGDSVEQDFQHRLADYWAARNAFLRSGVDVHETFDIRDLLAQTREPLLSAVRMSNDFNAAYDPLLGMARALYEADAQAARTLLTDLETANPKRSEATLLRRQLFGE